MAPGASTLSNTALTPPSNLMSALVSDGPAHPHTHAHGSRLKGHRTAW